MYSESLADDGTFPPEGFIPSDASVAVLGHITYSSTTRANTPYTALPSPARTPPRLLHYLLSIIHSLRLTALGGPLSRSSVSFILHKGTTVVMVIGNRHPVGTLWYYRDRLILRLRSYTVSKLSPGIEKEDYLNQRFTKE